MYVLERADEALSVAFREDRSLRHTGGQVSSICFEMAKARLTLLADGAAVEAMISRAMTHEVQRQLAAKLLAPIRPADGAALAAAAQATASTARTSVMARRTKASASASAVHAPAPAAVAITQAQ